MQWRLARPEMPQRLAGREVVRVQTVAVSGRDSERRYERSSGLCRPAPARRADRDGGGRGLEPQDCS